MMVTPLFIGGIGMQEVLLIVLVVLLFFGGKKIPELMKGIGKGVRSFKEGMNNVEKEIDEINILQATFLAMSRVVNSLSVKPDFVLVDGNRDPKLGIKTETVIKGDALSASIAAASVLAKVTRDHYMLEMCKQYPQYMFEKHKGYGTKLHYEMIEKYGISDIHRKSFLKKLTGEK